MKHALRIAALALALCLPLAGPVAADQLDDGLAAYKSGDYATALRLWQPLAEQGNAKAQYRLGDMHMFGEGIPADVAQAVKWYQLSADHDFPNAQFALGFMYMSGIGVNKEYVQAMKWFRICERHAGFAYAASRSAVLVKNKMTPDQIAEAERLAREWKPQ